MELNREFALLAQCCRSNFAGEQAQLALSEPVDWQRFLRLARFHRVEGLAWRALRSFDQTLPEAVTEALSSDAASIAAAALHAAAECDRLRAEFEHTRTPLLFLKGLTLGVLAYGTAPVKAAADIDILIAPENLDRARESLDRMGYRLDVPSPRGVAALSRWHRLHKESNWVKRGSGTPIDLHTRVADNSRLLAGIDVHSRHQRVPIGNGIVLPTLAPDTLCAYLAVHGASSAWFRLKWLSDFAALVSQLSGAAILEVYQRAEELGARRAAGQALLLADRFFKTLDVAPELRSELGLDRAIVRLYRAALNQLAGRPEPVEPTETRLGTLTIHHTQFLLQRDAAYKTSELVRQVRSILH